MRHDNLRHVVPAAVEANWSLFGDEEKEAASLLLQLDQVGTT